MIKIDICTTATLRHVVLETTLKSFTYSMLSNRDRFRLIINIDPIGDKLKRRNAVLQIAYKYFKNVVYNFPETPGFTKAVQWCWSQTTAPYVFHLEDDWKLLTPINIDSMIEVIEKYNLTSLRLSKDPLRSSKHSCRFGFIYSPQISLNPTIFRGEIIRKIYPLMDLDKNPEKQLRVGNPKFKEILANAKHGIYQKNLSGRVVLDIGRKWMKTSIYKKKTGFLNWERKVK